MSNTHDNGGPAFPVYDHHSNGQQFLAHIGVTLRDYFAAKAMQGMLSHEQCDYTPMTRQAQDQAAADAYTMADAMMAARAKQADPVRDAAPEPLEAARCALAALDQPATFPSDIELAKRVLADDIAKATGSAA